MLRLTFRKQKLIIKVKPFGITKKGFHSTV